MTDTQKERPRRPTNGQFVGVEGGLRRYLIAPRRGRTTMAAGIQPISAAHFRGLVTSIPGAEVVRTIRSRRTPPGFTLGSGEATDLYVVRMKEEQAELLRQTAPAHVIVEEDVPLDLGSSVAAVQEPPQAATWKAASRIDPKSIRFRVLGREDKPLDNAAVTLFGDGFPVQARTDEKGEVALNLYAFAGQSPRSVLVNAERDHWDRFVAEPELSDSQVNVIRLQGLDETIPGFPEQYHYGWGARAMGLDRLDRRLTGKGVKIAILDSGIDNTHPLLKHIQQGMDLTTGEDKTTWTEDLIGHGSHCAGTIAAQAAEGHSSMRGFAPEAEIHALKIFPGGRLSNLIDALDLCIEREIDVANISLSTERPSLAVEQKLEECVLSGVACIVAAGNTGGAVKYPASSPWVLAVSAIGRLGEMPANTWELSTVLPTQVAPDGVFSPKFTCSGPEIGVCAPGVGVISTVPGGGFEPQSGTSIAAPHVAGLAGLLLAHHPWFGMYRVRDLHRVNALFGLIQAMCTPYGFLPGRVGAGLPTLDVLQQVIAQTAAFRGGVQATPGKSSSITEPSGGTYLPDWGINGYTGLPVPAGMAGWFMTPTVPPTP